MLVVRDKIKHINLFLSGIALLLVASLPLYAASQPITPAQGLEISPPVISLNANPGQSVKTSLKLRNITTSPLLVRSEIDDFTAQGENGLPQVILNGEATAYSLKAYVQPVGDFTLAPQQQKTIAIIIKVPQNAPPGGHYGVIRFSGIPPQLNGQQGLALSASLGSLILLTVSGDVTHNLSFAEFFASQNDHKGSFFARGPITLSERLDNSGNVHEQPSGSVRVTNIFGQKVADIAINTTGGNILPSSIRRFDETFSKHFMIGRYSATANITYADNKIISAKISFWVIPYKLITIAIVVLVGIVLLVRFGLGGYKRRIIKQQAK